MRIADATAAEFGVAAGGVGDVNGDGFADIAIAGGSSLFVYLGGPGGPGAPTAFATKDAAACIAAATDVNGDGFADAVIGEPSATIYTNMTMPVIRARSTFARAARRPGLEQITLLPAPSYYLAPSSYDPIASAGDVNGDGFGDIVVGATQGPSNPGYGYPIWATPAASAPPRFAPGLRRRLRLRDGRGRSLKRDGFARLHGPGAYRVGESFLGGAAPPTIQAASWSLYQVVGTAL